MLSKEEVEELLQKEESDQIERTTSVKEDKISEVVCAFSSDLPNHKEPGYILFGVNDDGSIAGMNINDKQLQSIGGIKSNGNILPQPSLTVSEVYKCEKGDIVVIEVFPSDLPPVRYKGRCYIRVGSRKAIANETEIRRLSEKRTSTAKTFDASHFRNSKIDDLDIGIFESTYLPQAIDRETLEGNGRDIKDKLAALRFFDGVHDCSTNAGILLLAIDPQFYIKGAYIQYVKFAGKEMTSEEVEHEKEFSGPLITELQHINGFVKNNIVKSKLIRTNSMKEDQVYNYPLWTLREFVMNAIMHRDYESNAPIYIYEFSDRIEITNPGGLYGASRENFPRASDYRNPVIAEAMKNMGYVNRFNYGVINAQKKLEENGSPEAIFNLDTETTFQVTIKIHPNWQ